MNTYRTIVLIFQFLIIVWYFYLWNFESQIWILICLLNPEIGYDGKEFSHTPSAHQMLIRDFKNYGQCIPLEKIWNMNAFADAYQQFQFAVKIEDYNS